jgi:hypothetical protein
MTLVHMRLSKRRDWTGCTTLVLVRPVDTTLRSFASMAHVIMCTRRVASCQARACARRPSGRQYMR